MNEALTIKTERVESLRRIFPSRTLTIAPLDQEQTRRLLQSTLPLSPEAEAIAIERSHGNPLFALQLIHAWAGGGYFQLQGGLYSVPSQALHGRAVTTAELWEERLCGVPEPYRPAAYAAASLGADIPIDPLRELLSSLPRSTSFGSAMDVEPAIAALQRAQLLVPEPGERFRWAHALLQEHVFGRLLELPQARTIFRLSADALLFHPDAGTDRIVRHRAQNLLYAGEDTLAAEVLFNFITVAWSRVRDVPATRSMLALLEGRVSGRYEGLHLRWRAEASRHAGNLSESREGAERAAALFGGLGEGDSQAHCERLLGQIACDEGRPAHGRAPVERAYARFLASGNDVGRADGEFVLGQIDALLGDYESASERLSHAAAGFRLGGEQLALAQCILVQARAEMAAGRRSLTRALLVEARGEFEKLGYPLGLAQSA